MKVHSEISLACLFLPLVLGASPPVKVQLRSSWPAPELLLEIIESAAAERAQSFFPVFDLLTAPPSFTKKHAKRTQQEIFSTALETLDSLGYLSDPTDLASFHLSLSLHSATPKIEAFYQYYNDVANSSSVEWLGDKLDCISWVDWHGKRVCDLAALKELYEDPASQPKLLSFDHVLPDPSKYIQAPLPTAILYVSFESISFRVLHKYLYDLSNRPEPRVQYIIRYVPPQKPSPDPRRNTLSGYGVIMDLKKMDYLALDDRRGGAPGESTADKSEAHAAAEDPVQAILEKLPELDTNSSALPADEFIDIGLKATQLIVNSSDPLATLQDLSQSFPKYASTIVRRVEVHENVSQEISQKNTQVQAGMNAIWLNGRVIPTEDLNPFGLMRTLRKERQIMTSLTGLGLTPSQAVDVITNEAIADALSKPSILDERFDASDRPEGGKALVWWNDIEADSRYERWPTALTGLMQQLFPGQFHRVRRNLNNIVMVVDLTSGSVLDILNGPITNIIGRALPFRFGVVPAVETESGIKAARLFYYLIENYGPETTLGFFSAFATAEHTPLDFDQAKAAFEKLVEGEAPRVEEASKDFDAIVSGLYEDRIEAARSYSERLGASLAASAGGHAFVNGKHLDVDENFFRGLQSETNTVTNYLQEQIYYGKLSDSEDGPVDMATYFYDMPTTSTRRNKHIYPSGGPNGLQIHNLQELFASSNVIVKTKITSKSFVYSRPDDLSQQVPLSIWVVGDLNAPSTLSLLKEALKAILTLVSASELLAFIERIEADPVAALSPDNGSGSQSHLTAESRLLEIVNAHTFERLDHVAYDGYCHATKLMAHLLKLNKNENSLIINGRIVGPIKPNEMISADISALAAYELRKRVAPVVEALQPIFSNTERNTFAHIVSTASSIINSASLGSADQKVVARKRQYLSFTRDYTSFEIGEKPYALFQIAALIDPVSESAQKWAPLLKWLSSIEEEVHVHVTLNPAMGHTELPLKRFYQYNLRPQLTFDMKGREQDTFVKFKGLPIDPIYTLGMDTHPAWLVRPFESEHDLDNIHLSSLTASEIKSGVKAIFDLDYIILEGHAREGETPNPPRGVQLQLTTSDSTPVADTLIVANLGYFQFKATPGVYQLSIREGRGREVWEMQSVGNNGYHSPSIKETGSGVSLTDFEGVTIYPRLVKRPGMGSADVLDTEPPIVHQGVLGSLFSNIVTRFGSFVNPKKEQGLAQRQADINIFTVASGLLYERFASIMILSVMRNTNSTVKFWFIENFLSPSFLEFIPHLAKAYNFEYELVTYKWPSWLRGQKEKQRVIWGYKILFLDVLFPMDLKKVIFVDADQIVRTDLKELVALDLHGAPYGYTPMGDDNTDMEGFRFWKTGYWKDYLRGKPYHISALYVIDLVRFRELAAGDRLRSQYQMLSSDPNSLANLDQDLPNHLQHEVPIYSLDKSWLWCETWCTKDRLDQAKTIDLCQNPLTKEPKLSRARQIPEWEEYDSEIARFARQLADDGKIKSRAIAADSDVLATVGNTRQNDSPESDIGPEASQGEIVEDKVDGDGHSHDEL
ncbi:glycosyltransferase family 24 protein [Botryobasidium botryosum FD-172 SS1]|uniref:Glycosyltransferase family 24 protein n=1 Tax=Botryobasidium botryosum (strain FD-172 SS1) TaxID=930990 RepID=A0A067LY69_BOTB1|nr:glycosyltransferase family 24 protein [Botryobasidium botryosum FD-172 SS1]